MRQKMQTFQGATLNEAYRAMRAELGNDAVVLRTAHLREGGFFGLLGRKRVEVTAAAPVDAAEPRGAKPRARSAAERRYAANARRGAAPLADRADPAAGQAGAGGGGVGSDEAISETVAHFQRLVRDAKARVEAPPRPSGTEAPKADEQPGNPPGVVPFKPRRLETAGSGPAEPDNAALIQQMRDLREMVQVLVAESPGAGLPREFAPHYRALVEKGVTKRVAASVVSSVVKGADLRVLNDAAALGRAMRVTVARRVRVTGGIAIEPGCRRVVAFAGPTGVGKTTTLAKIAALYAVRHQARVGVVTIDTYRVAAPQQLRVYTDIMGLPLHVVNEPAEMGAALDALRRCDLVLIDTAGGSHYNTRQLHEVADLLAPARPDEVHLVLAAHTHVEDARQVVERFRPLGPTALLFTKLDETRRYGALFSVAAETEIALSYFGTGQNVPDDLATAHPNTVAKLVVEDGDHRGTPGRKSP